MKTLAVDPGTTETAYVLYHDTERCLIAKGKVLNDELLQLIECNFRPDTVYCEMVASYGMSVGQEVFETCVFIGQIKQLCLSNNIPFHYVYRKDVKMYLCGKIAKVNDAVIHRRLLDIFGEKGTKLKPNDFYRSGNLKSDEWSALAVLTTALEIDKLFV